MLRRHLKSQLLKLNWRLAGTIMTLRVTALRLRTRTHSRDARRIPGPAGARGPTKPERTEHLKPAGTEMPPSPSPSQGPRSPRSSSKSKLLFAILFSFKKKKKKNTKGGELRGWARKVKVLGQLPEWVSSVSSHHPRERGELLWGQEGTLSVRG